MQAYRGAQYEDAIEHFQRAARLDPAMKVAHLYLATAYGQMYVPGVETPENVANANNALEQYLQVQRMDSENMIAVKGVAYINMQLKKFKEARDSYKRAAEIDPNDPETFYGAGGDKAAHEADVEKANAWSDKAMGARKKKAEEAAKKSQAPADTPLR